MVKLCTLLVLTLVVPLALSYKQPRRSLAFSRDSEEYPGDRVLEVSNWRENFTPTTHLEPRKLKDDDPAKATKPKPQDSSKPKDSSKSGDSKKSRFQRFLAHFKDGNTLVTGFTGFAQSLTTAYRNIMTSRDVEHDDEGLEELSESDLDAGELDDEELEELSESDLDAGELEYIYTDYLD